MKTLISLDIETTDLSPEKGEIIEFGAVKYEDGKIVDSYKKLFKPRDGKIPFIITTITGIKEEDLVGKEIFDLSKDEIANFIGDYDIVGHNIGFDIEFLKENGIALEKNKLIDTFRLSSMLLPGFNSYSLEALTRKLEISHIEKHRALDDAKASLELLLLLQSKIKELSKETLAQIRDIVSRSEWDMGWLFDKSAVKEYKSAVLSSSKTKKHIKIRSSIEKISEFNSANIEKLFESKKLKKEFPNFEYRADQVKFAKIVSDALSKNKKALIEAGTGIGKSMAYLLPAAYFAKARDEQVIISTGTKTLQDQLVNKDIPSLEKFLPFEFRWSSLKGRNNYLCYRKLEEVLNRKSIDPIVASFLVKIVIWLSRSSTGDLSEMNLNFEERRLIYLVNTSGIGSCFGNLCPSKKDCFIQKARIKAQNSHIVVVNHSLLLSNPKIDNSDVLLGEHVIVDEAHKLEDSATSAYSEELRLSLFTWLAKNIKSGASSKKSRIRVTDEKISELASGLSAKVDMAFGLAGMFTSKFNNNDSENFPRVIFEERVLDAIDFDRMKKAFDELEILLMDLASEFTKFSETKANQKRKMYLRGLADECLYFATKIKYVFGSMGQGSVVWSSVFENEEVVIVSSPVKIGDILLERLYKTKRSIILTSATLDTFSEKPFEYFANSLALNGFEFHKIPSGYDFKNRSLVILPDEISHPSNREYSSEVVKIVNDIAKKINGRTLVLFTSHAAVRTVYKKLFQPLKESGIELLAQGVTGGRAKILDRFKESKSAVLLGTDSFWEGIDVSGDQLQAVVITKLPFVVPTEPIHYYRQKQYTSGFKKYALPLAILKFRQGFGRLIRSRKDKGVVVVLDSRIKSENYGAMFIKSLPEIGIVECEKSEIGHTAKNWIDQF